MIFFGFTEPQIISEPDNHTCSSGICDISLQATAYLINILSLFFLVSYVFFSCTCTNAGKLFKQLILWILIRSQH